MKNGNTDIIFRKLTALFLGLLVFWGSTCFAATTVTLQWNANIEDDLAGYKLYYKIGTTGGEPYNGIGATKDGEPADSPIDVGNIVEVTLDVPTGQSYIFALTAYDNENPPLESGYSIEVPFDAVETESHTVDFVSGNYGSISGTVTQTVADGGDCTLVTAIPVSNYLFVNWTGDGFTTSTINPLTVTNVQRNLTITANFERKDDDNDGVDTIEEMGPDGNDASYDGNHDGIPDSQQDNIASFYINIGEYRTLELSFIDQDEVERDTRLEIVKNPDTSEIENYSPERFMGESVIYSGGFYSFIAHCEDTQTVCGEGNFTPEAKIYFHKALPPLESRTSEVATWCDDSGQCHDFEYKDATDVGVLFPNRDGSESIAVIKLKDGEIGDSDGTKNGRIEY